MLLLSGRQQESSSFFLARPLKLSFILYIIAYSKSIVVMSKKPFFCTFIILIASLSAMFSTVHIVRIIIICLLSQANQAKKVMRKIHRSRCYSGKNIAAQPRANKSAIDQKPIRRRRHFTRGSYALDLSLGHLASFIQALILESVKKLEELFIAPTAHQILHETAQRAFARCECA